MYKKSYENVLFNVSNSPALVAPVTVASSLSSSHFVLYEVSYSQRSKISVGRSVEDTL